MVCVFQFREVGLEQIGFSDCFTGFFVDYVLIFFGDYVVAERVSATRVGIGFLRWNSAEFFRKIVKILK